MWIGMGAMGGGLRTQVGERVGRVLQCDAGWVTTAERPPDTWDPRRGQHGSSGLLRWMSGLRPPPARRLLGLTDVDLFIPVLTFVFGEAQLGGAAAVVSTARLGPPGELLAARLAKEAVHELGHTWGLVHCDVQGCVMLRSAALKDVDAKSDEPCRDCRSRLADARRAMVSDFKQHAMGITDPGFEVRYHRERTP